MACTRKENFEVCLESPRFIYLNFFVDVPIRYPNNNFGVLLHSDGQNFSLNLLCTTICFGARDLWLFFAFIDIFRHVEPACGVIRVEDESTAPHSSVSEKMEDVNGLI